MSTILSKIKRDKMLETISKIKENIEDDETLKNLSLIEYELTKKKYGLVWEEHEENVDIQLETNIATFEEIKENNIVTSEDKEYNFLSLTSKSSILIFIIITPLFYYIINFKINPF